MKYYDEYEDEYMDDDLPLCYSNGVPYINPYDSIVENDEYDYFQESFDDDLRKGLWHGNKVW